MKNTTKLLFMLIVLIASCKKDETNTSSNSTILPTFLIKTISYAAGEPKNPNSETFFANYEYDSLKRVTQIAVNGLNSYRFTYFKGMVLLQYLDTLGVIAGTDTCLLNPMGYVMNTGGWTYSYNANGFLQSAVEFGTTVPEQYFWLNGNMVKVLHSNNFSDDYSYYTDKIDNRIGLVNMDYIPSFHFSIMGIKSKNLISSVYKNFSDSKDNTTTAYTYQMDDKGRIIKETRITTYASGQNPPLTETFVYGYYD